MSRISDMEEQISNMYAQIKLMEDTLIKTKLQEGVRALKEKGELSDEESSDYIITDEAILLRILDEQGIGKNGYCWISTDRHEHEYGYYIMKIDGDYISISPGGRLCMQSIESIKELLHEIAEDTWMYTLEDISKYINTITNLTDIDLEHLKPRSQEKMPDEPEVTFEEDDYEYDDDYYQHDRVYETEEDIEARWDMDIADDEPEWDDYEDLIAYDSIKDIEHIFLGDWNNRGELDEEAVTKLNSMSREILKKYFEMYPDDIASFEKMRIKYPNIRSLDEREAEEHSEGNQEKMPNEPEVTLEEDDYEYDEVVELMSEIYHLLRDDDFGFDHEFEVQVAIKLNSMSLEILKKYFELNPEDIELFEDMRMEYPDIVKSLAEREAEEHSAGNDFVSNIVGYATKKVEVREQNAQAAQLAQDYEQQLPANEQSLDDE